MAMDKQMAKIVACIAAESEDRLDVRLLRQYDPGTGFDRVLKMQRGAQVRIECPKRIRFRPIGVKNGQNVRDALGAVVVKLLEAADRQHGKRRLCQSNGRSTLEGSPMNSAIGHLWTPLAATPLLWLAVTIAAYVVGRLAQRACRDSPFASPVLIAILLVAAVVVATRTSYQTYFGGAQFINFLLGPATIALAVPL